MNGPCEPIQQALRKFGKITIRFDGKDFIVLSKQPNDELTAHIGDCGPMADDLADCIVWNVFAAFDESLEQGMLDEICANGKLDL